MVIELNFNDPNVLHAYLYQALPQIGLQDNRDRFFIGKNGGLAYRLFRREDMSMNNLPINFRVFNPSEASEVVKYFARIESYLHTVNLDSQEFGFELLDTAGDDPRKLNMDGDNVYFAGVGSMRITGEEKFSSLLRFVNDSKPLWEKHYAAIKENARKILTKD